MFTESYVLALIIHLATLIFGMVHVNFTSVDCVLIRQLLLGFETGTVVVWSLRGKTAEHRCICPQVGKKEIQVIAINDCPKHNRQSGSEGSSFLFTTIQQTFIQQIRGEILAIFCTLLGLSQNLMPALDLALLKTYSVKTRLHKPYFRPNYPKSVPFFTVKLTQQPFPLVPFLPIQPI